MDYVIDNIILPAMPFVFAAIFPFSFALAKWEERYDSREWEQSCDRQAKHEAWVRAEIARPVELEG